MRIFSWRLIQIIVKNDCLESHFIIQIGIFQELSRTTFEKLNLHNQLTCFQMTQTIKQQSRLAYLNPAFKNKVGVFYSKDQKIISLEKQNEIIKDQLERQLELYNQLLQKTKQIESKNNRMNNQNSLLQIQHQMLEQAVQKLQRKIKQNEPSINKLKEQVASISQQSNLVQQSLESQLKRVNENDQMIKRYKEQIKTEKLMLKSQKNVTKISQTFKKSYENYQKNIEILENKLESKKKYLMILTKKAEKIKNQQMVQNKIENNKRPATSISSSKSKTQMNKNYDLNPQKLEQAQIKNNLKNYNDLIRKKNAILAQKK